METERTVVGRKKSKKKGFRKAGAYAVFFILGAMVILLVFGQVYNSRFTKVKTEIAYPMTISNVIEADGYVIRNENVIVSELSGVSAYAVSNGARVAKGAAVANVYSTNEQASAQQKIKRLQAEIEELSDLQSASINTGTDPELLNKQIEDKLSSLVGSVNSGNLSEIDSLRSHLLYSMSKYNIVTGAELDYNDRISVLKDEVKVLQEKYSSTSEKITAPESGYFIGATDGYESFLTTQNVLTMTPQNLESALAQRSGYDTSNDVGKIVNEYDWYFVSILDDEQASSLKKGKSLKIILPFTSVEEVPVKVNAINYDKSGEKALVVFACNYMSSDLAILRYQPVQILLSNPSGIKISTRAIRTEAQPFTATDENQKEFEATREVKYVYVLSGSQVKKRYITVLYEDTDSDIAICKITTGSDETTENVLKAYDEVIVEGANLYDGKIVQ